MRAGVEPFDDLLGFGRVVAKPDRPGEDEDVGVHDLPVEVGPGIGLPAVLRHVRPHTGGDVVVDRPDHIDARPPGRHDRGAAVDQPLGVARSGERFRVQLMNRARRLSNRPRQRAVPPRFGHRHPRPLFHALRNTALTLVPGTRLPRGWPGHPPGTVAGPGAAGSEPGVDRLAFQRQHAEHALVHAEQRLAPGEPVQCLGSQRELAGCQRPLTGKVAPASRLRLAGMAYSGP